MFRHHILIKTLITSKTRVKLLLKFFLNPLNSAYLRGLSEELEESTNAVRLELNRLEAANMLHSSKVGNKKMFTVNKLILLPIILKFSFTAEFIKLHLMQLYLN